VGVNHKADIAKLKLGHKSFQLQLCKPSSYFSLEQILPVSLDFPQVTPVFCIDRLRTHSYPSTGSAKGRMRRFTPCRQIAHYFSQGSRTRLEAAKVVKARFVMTVSLCYQLIPIVNAQERPFGTDGVRRDGNRLRFFCPGGRAADAGMAGSRKARLQSSLYRDLGSIERKLGRSGFGTRPRSTILRSRLVPPDPRSR
jgi:hypothetical protein